MNNRVVLSVGGSSVVPEGKPNIKFLRELADIIKESKNSFGIVVGGGPPARIYANAVRELGANEFDADEIAIMSTRQNAKLMVAALGESAFPHTLVDFTRARDHIRNYKVVVMGGTIPGITTDADTVLLAESIGAKRLVNVSNVEAVYDSDPRKNPNAKKYQTMSFRELAELGAKSDNRNAGTNFVFDMLACKLIARSGIETHFVSWSKTDDLKNAIEGKKHNGTVVKG